MRRKTIGLILGILTAAAVTVSLSGCASSTALKDGYYTAQASDYWGSGWKEFVMITVKGGRIIAVEYNAEDANGFAKSWDTEYLQNMMDCQGTYPNEYMRAYINQLLEEQVAGKVIKEMDYMFRVQEEKDEERFRNLDEMIRKKQKGRKEAAAARIPSYAKPKTKKRFFGKKEPF